MNTGTHYEALAAQRLEAAGLHILERNFLCKSGEIDIICQDGKQLVFVEVRYRRAGHYASAAASVTRAKQRKLQRAALVYLQRKGWLDKVPCRFDVIAITGKGRRLPTSTPLNFNDTQTEHLEVQWLKHAFTT